MRVKPVIHAKNSVRRYGGTYEDYMDIHELMDSSKACLPLNLHRVLCHQSWFIKTIIPKIFGHQRINSEGKTYIPENVAEEHVLEDFGMKFIPTVQDYLENVNMASWMNGQGLPPSCRPIQKDEQSDIREAELAVRPR